MKYKFPVFRNFLQNKNYAFISIKFRPQNITDIRKNPKDLTWPDKVPRNTWDLRYGYFLKKIKKQLLSSSQL